jgi:hypothetical protein
MPNWKIFLSKNKCLDWKGFPQNKNPTWKVFPQIAQPKKISDQVWVESLVTKHFMYQSPPSHLVHLYGVSDKL